VLTYVAALANTSYIYELAGDNRCVITVASTDDLFEFRKKK
jgi:hypothetical protein